MTTERTNHVERATELGELATDSYNAGRPEAATGQLLGAQVHATLALVEQQRIANLIAIARETHADLISGLEAMGLDENDFEVPLGLNNLKKASV